MEETQYIDLAGKWRIASFGYSSTLIINKNEAKRFQKQLSTIVNLKEMPCIQWFKSKMREIEDILLIFIVRMKYTIFSYFQQSKQKW